MLSWLAVLMTCAKAGERRSGFEELLVRIESLHGMEAAIEASERRARAMSLAKRKTDVNLTRVNVSAPDYWVPTAAELASRLVAVSGQRRLSLRQYLKSAEKRKPARTRTTSRVFFDWGTDGYLTLGRCLGIALVPVRAIYELIGLATVNLAATAAARWPAAAGLHEALDVVRRMGPAKALVHLHPAWDPSKNGLTSIYYASILYYTKALREVLRAAWRTPLDVYWWYETRRIMYELGHQGRHDRIEAALLRVARDKVLSHLANIRSIRKRRHRERESPPEM